MDIKFLTTLPHTLYKRVSPERAAPRSPSDMISSVNRQNDQILQAEGKDEQTKNEATKKEEDKQAVNDLIKKSNRRIISISSLFPWNLFPNSIEVEESRVTFIFRQFLSSQSHSVDIKDISNVFLQTSPFFATLQIVSRTFIQNDITVTHLNIRNAHAVKMIIEGLRTLVEHNVDTSTYEIDELIEKIKEFNTNTTA